MVILSEPVPGPPGSGTFAMPFHDPHDVSTNATAAAAPGRRAIRLHLRVAIPAFCLLPTRLITHLPQPVALVPAGRPEPVRAPARRVRSHPAGRPRSHRARGPAAAQAARTTA